MLNSNLQNKKYVDDMLGYCELCDLNTSQCCKALDQHNRSHYSSALFLELMNMASFALLSHWINCLFYHSVSENDDDNLILGLGVDKVSCYGNLKVQLGVEEQRELSPFCVLLCLTLEGKLVMFQVARYFPWLPPYPPLHVNIMWFLLLS